ncbi:hypothetical protein CRUP_030140 [Coryphaenoides rupestris]|nr:hypothetical protein CRUP_030140 [Coryphaenoides rupestris]
MSGLGKPFTMGLVLLLGTLSGHCGESASTAATAVARSDLSASRQHTAGASGHMDRDSRDHSNTETATRSTARKEAPTVPRDLRNLRTERAGDTNIGPLYFSPKCKKHMHRLYHNTRDCTIPACCSQAHAIQQNKNRKTRKKKKTPLNKERTVWVQPSPCELPSMQ